MKQSEMFDLAMQRPSDYEELSGEDQWMVDKELGILDWDGSCPHSDCKPCSECWDKYKATHKVTEVL